MSKSVEPSSRTVADSTVPTTGVVTSLVNATWVSPGTVPVVPGVPCTVTVEGAAPEYVASSRVHSFRDPVSPPLWSFTSSDHSPAAGSPRKLASACIGARTGWATPLVYVAW